MAQQYDISRPGGGSYEELNPLSAPLWARFIRPLRMTEVRFLFAGNPIGIDI